MALTVYVSLAENLPIYPYDAGFGFPFDFAAPPAPCVDPRHFPGVGSRRAACLQPPFEQLNAHPPPPSVPSPAVAPTPIPAQAASSTSSVGPITAVSTSSAASTASLSHQLGRCFTPEISVVWIYRWCCSPSHISIRQRILNSPGGWRRR
jgi:hypothetical protein